jgi:hypothetical protein
MRDQTVEDGPVALPTGQSHNRRVADASVLVPPAITPSAANAVPIVIAVFPLVVAISGPIWRC